MGKKRYDQHDVSAVVLLAFQEQKKGA